uniref:NADH-ubiquinone oxidoreductase chain 4 n=1 Tax=Acropyga pallida TaxID=602221 RepID=A0A6G5NIF3_9HYME|nr:NADH dehydrogenase subunit 4 [Acropyga pallida]QBG38650.1 NADH dehydrogenase subunit 4 [Acropyga pallida]
MMKINFILLFMFIFLFMNKKIMFFYNIIYLLSFFFLFKFMFKDSLIWIDLSLYFGLDFYSYYMLVLSLWVMGLVFMVIQFEESSEDKYIYIKKLLLFLIMLMILIIFFSSLNLLLFYLMFELSLIPMFIIIIYWGMNFERLVAAYYLLMYTIFISLPLFIYLIKLLKFNGSFDFNLMMIMKINMSSGDNKVGLGLGDYLILFLAFYIKLPIYIFHVWLPKAHVESPVYGSMILAAILLKLGGFGLLRFMKMFIMVSVKFNYMIFSVSIIGSLLLSLVCLIQIDMKKLVAYSSVVHMNILLCSLLTMMKLGAVSAYILMISHGLCSSGLFFMVNLYYERSLSRLMFFNKGMMNLFSLLSFWWFILCVANFSFPFSMNFFSEIFMIMVIISWDIILMIFMMMICFFSSAYSLYLYSYIQQGFLYYENKFYMINLKDFMVLFIHVSPLILFIVNLSLFY